MSIYEDIMNNDEKTRKLCSKFRLKVLKMPKEDVPDPAKRFIEVGAFHAQAGYCATMLIGAGYKTAIIEKLTHPDFPLKVQDDYQKLVDFLEESEHDM